MGKCYLGIDLGGTSAKLGVVDESGALLHQREEPTLSDEGAEDGLLRMASSLRRLTREVGIPWDAVAGLGLGLPGFLDIPRGRIIRLTNIPWEDVPVKEYLEQELQIPVAIDNDANAAALGEAWSGAGAGRSDLILVTLGTGVGGGLVTGGRLVRGVNGMAGEIGHIRVEERGALCGCGQRGCVETISSATGMTRLVREAVLSGGETILAKKAQSGSLEARGIFEAAELGDPIALKVIDAATDALARVMAVLSVVTNPEVFIIGGGISKAGEGLFAPLRQAYAKHALPQALENVQIVPAQLGNDAGMIGAAGLTAKREKMSYNII
ncbi:ROK family glucokinase [Paludifilum halophilum]|uniref:Glucokinase n=1 Tax=Paludifilum halophilum TaxID=1642702 RepID=A0A235B7E5_9BACL|nr:ROK family glucokinase [Paludifilum halophilum]OYD08216.1 glucokinase [Paludifilum halophilum]